MVAVWLALVALLLVAGALAGLYARPQPRPAPLPPPRAYTITYAAVSPSGRRLPGVFVCRYPSLWHGQPNLLGHRRCQRKGP
jgi:hypothetical protein